MWSLVIKTFQKVEEIKVKCLQMSLISVGEDGVAGTLDALRLKLPTLLMIGSSCRRGPTSSNNSLSVRPVYLNFVPKEKKLPPETTGTTDPEGKL